MHRNQRRALAPAARYLGLHLSAGIFPQAVQPLRYDSRAPYRQAIPFLQLGPRQATPRTKPVPPAPARTAPPQLGRRIPCLGRPIPHDKNVPLPHTGAKAHRSPAHKKTYPHTSGFRFRPPLFHRPRGIRPNPIVSTVRNMQLPGMELGVIIVRKRNPPPRRPTPQQAIRAESPQPVGPPLCCRM